MSLTLDQLSGLRAPFYRVVAKAIVFDSRNRLVLVRNGDSDLEILGGGLEDGESLEDCVRREAQEEAGVDLCNVSGVIHVQTATSKQFGWPVCRLILRANLVSEAYVPGDGMEAVVTATADELESLSLTKKDAKLIPLIRQLWPKESA